MLYFLIFDDADKSSNLHGKAFLKFQHLQFNPCFADIVKRLMDMKVVNQVLTSGVLLKTRPASMYRRDIAENANSIIYNIVMKINAKLGGINCEPNEKVDTL